MLVNTAFDCMDAGIRCTVYGVRLLYFNLKPCTVNLMPCHVFAFFIALSNPGNDLSITAGDVQYAILK